jgi:hypothetical protein
VPLHAARIEDLGPGDLVRVECIACGHDILIPPSSLLHGLRLPPYTPVLDLEPWLRCRKWDIRGKAVVSIGVVLAREPCREEGSPQLTIVGLRQ